MVLGISNRTENWKTAYEFAPYFSDEKARTNIVKQFLGTDDVSTSDVQIELFWKGVRDYYSCRGGRRKMNEDALLKSFFRLFPNIATDIEKFEGNGSFQALEERNYLKGYKEADFSENSHNDLRSKFSDNLYNTEIDIVLATPEHLFIGEAKHLTGFHARSSLILVHQLVRQYVMATILIDRMHSDKNLKRRKIVPFVVGDCTDRMKKQVQIKFMLEKKWLHERNILSWEDVANISKSRSVC